MTLRSHIASALLMAILGCAGGAASEGSTIVETLRSAGLTVTDAGMVQQPFFTVPAHVVLVNGKDLQIYTFATAVEAEQAASQVAPNGSSIGPAMMSWLAPPHFFRKDRVIANYLGSDAKTLAELQRLFGSQFAGR